MVNLPFLLTWWNPWPRCWCCLARVQNVCHKAHSRLLKGQKRNTCNACNYSKSVYEKMWRETHFQRTTCSVQNINHQSSRWLGLFRSSLSNQPKPFHKDTKQSFKQSLHICELYVIFLKQNSLHWFCRPVSWLRWVSWVSAGKRCAPAASPFLP